MQRVLIVDDQREVRQVLHAAIQTLDQAIEVVDVPSGEEALFVLASKPFDLLVVDVRLAGISGLELKRRALLANPKLKIIIITGLADPAIHAQIEAAGAEAVFHKPVEIPDFLAAVQRCVRKDNQPGASSESPVAAPSRKPASIKPPATPPKQHKSPSKEMTLSSLLEQIKVEAEAQAVIILDGQSRVVVQVGPSMKFGDTSLLFNSLVKAVHAGTSVAQLLGASGEGCLYYFPGRTTSIAATAAGEEYTLLVILSAARSNLEQAWRVIHAAALDVPALLSKELHSNHPEEQRTKLLEPDPGIEPPESAGSDPSVKAMMKELDGILAGNSGTPLLPEEVDAYWEAAQSLPQDSTTREDAISYQQARKLGLAPDEDESPQEE